MKSVLAVTTAKTCRRRYVTCWGCKRPSQRHEGHGLCRACHGRWDVAGRPPEGPPPPMPPQMSGRLGALHKIERYAARLEDYAWLESTGSEIAEAAMRLGVSEDTVRRYRRALRDQPTQLPAFARTGYGEAA
jgi:hypothetical protein